jgi:ABC-type maltose transport system permease subunit
LFFTNQRIILLNKIVGNAPPKTLVTQFEEQARYYAAIRNTCGLMIIAPLVIMYVFCQNFLVQGIERSGLTAD